jgi:hypothetical protein
VKTQIGAAGGNRDLKNPVVGTASGNRNVSKIWVGSSGGNKLVWQRTVLSTTVTATAVSTTGIDVSWTATPGAVYTLFRRRTGVGGEVGLVANTSARTYQDRGLVEGAEYTYYVNVVVGGALIGHSNLASVTLGVTPPPQFVQKSWSGRATASASYNGSNNNRNVSEMYYGYYSGTNGMQKSVFSFDIPAEIRNCVSITGIDLAVWNIHTFQNSGTDVDLAVCHAPPASSWPGSSGPLRHNTADFPFRAPKGGWMGTWVQPDGWNRGIHVLSDPGRGITLAEEFRAHGAVGFALLPRTSAQSGYGYATGATGANYPQLTIHYTVRA